MLRLAQLKYPSFPLKVTSSQATVRPSTLEEGVADCAVYGQRDLLLCLGLSVGDTQYGSARQYGCSDCRRPVPVY